MLIVMWIAAALSGLIHVLFFCMESLWWTRPAVYRRFRSTETQAQTTKSLAFILARAEAPGVSSRP